MTYPSPAPATTLFRDDNREFWLSLRRSALTVAAELKRQSERDALNRVAYLTLRRPWLLLAMEIEEQYVCEERRVENA